MRGQYPFKVRKLTTTGLVAETSRVPDLDRILTLQLRLGPRKIDLHATVNDVVQDMEAGKLRTHVAFEFHELGDPKRGLIEAYLAKI